MLHKCANPSCGNPFQHLGQGKLFQIETEERGASAIEARGGAHRRRLMRRVERYWLCDQCAPWLTLVVERERGLITVPLPRSQRAPALAGAQMQVQKYPVAGAGS